MPSKSRTLSISEGVVSGAYIRFNLSQIIDDFFDIDRIVSESSCGEYNGDCDYQREGDTVVLDRYSEDDDIVYTILYRPSVKRINSFTDNEEELQIPENIASIIPYFVKGDLYRDDEPNEASEARNWFESAIEEMLIKRANKTNKVKTVYSQTE